ncbi:hypothetical protein RMCBS344292_13087 [Rhizopus microsporus]|nr:hypothetical protein RMCBS344292_13087 [Rhizopus microsporus]
MSTDTSSRAYASVDDLCRKNKSPLGRHVLNSFESVPQEGWQLIKKWIGKRQVSNNKLTIRNIERQAETKIIRIESLYL